MEAWVCNSHVWIGRETTESSAANLSNAGEGFAVSAGAGEDARACAVGGERILQIWHPRATPALPSRSFSSNEVLHSCLLMWWPEFGCHLSRGFSIFSLNSEFQLPGMSMAVGKKQLMPNFDANFSENWIEHIELEWNLLCISIFASNFECLEWAWRLERSSLVCRHDRDRQFHNDSYLMWTYLEFDVAGCSEKVNWVCSEEQCSLVWNFLFWTVHVFILVEVMSCWSSLWCRAWFSIWPSLQAPGTCDQCGEFDMGRYWEDSNGGVLGSSLPCSPCVSAHPLSGD